MITSPARFMKIVLLFTLILALAPLHAEPPPPIGKAVPLFNGQTLDGWEGDPKGTPGSVPESRSRNAGTHSRRAIRNSLARKSSQ